LDIHKNEWTINIFSKENNSIYQLIWSFPFCFPSMLNGLKILKIFYKVQIKLEWVCVWRSLKINDYNKNEVKQLDHYDINLISSYNNDVCIRSFEYCINWFLVDWSNCFARITQLNICRSWDNPNQLNIND
jgi:hypothetical protein